MAEPRDFLIEIGTEELPPVGLTSLIGAFRNAFLAGLRDNQLDCASIEHYATPRRLALLARDIPTAQPQQQKERLGPALAAAYDPDGKPTPAATGFARSCGVAVDELETVDTPKGERLIHRTAKPGRASADILPELVQQALDRMPIQKRMRWGTDREQFVRPVHWVLALYGDQILTTKIMGHRPGGTTFGHRFHHPDPISLDAPADYSPRLATTGYVIAEFDRRKEIIRAQAEAAAEERNGHAVIEEDLLQEVTALVEWPVAVLGRFDEAFLDVPREALISTMQDHQRYFPVVNDGGQLMPLFIAISNIQSREPETVIRGNERVLRPRFADANFFWEQDCKRTLASRLPDLEAVVYQRDLGSLKDRSLRLQELSVHLADKFHADVALARRAAEIAKCDLLTHMVNEFPELQGTMGRYYALNDGEDPVVAEALAEQYLPRFSGDVLPVTPLGQALAIAERLESILAIFSIGKQPTGASDPYALRRSALGVIRVAIERHLPVDLESDLAFASATFAESRNAKSVIPDVLEFFRERLKRYCLDRGYVTDEVEATAASGFNRPADFEKRLAAVSSFRKLEAAESLEAANKRTRNILKKAGVAVTGSLSEALLREPEEVALAAALSETRQRITPLLQDGEYQETLAILAELRGPVDAFFDCVLVMDEDAAVRANRLILLRDLDTMFSRIADFSRLQR